MNIMLAEPTQDSFKVKYHTAMYDALVLDFRVIFTSESALSIMLRPNPPLENELPFWYI